jgi:hypothetical protein
VGLPKEGDNVHERNNRWALYSALVRGIDRVRLIALWDGKAEPAKDLDARLVKHMVDLMRDMGGIVEQINPTKLVRTGRAPRSLNEKAAHVKPIKEKSASNGKTQKRAGPRKKK